MLGGCRVAGRVVCVSYFQTSEASLMHPGALRFGEVAKGLGVEKSCFVIFSSNSFPRRNEQSVPVVQRSMSIR